MQRPSNMAGSPPRQFGNAPMDRNNNFGGPQPQNFTPHGLPFQGWVPTGELQLNLLTLAERFERVQQALNNHQVRHAQLLRQQNRQYDPPHHSYLPYYELIKNQTDRRFQDEVRLWMDVLPQLQAEILGNAKIALRILNPISHAVENNRSYEVVTMGVAVKGAIQADQQQEIGRAWMSCIVSNDELVVQGPVTSFRFSAINELNEETSRKLTEVLPRAWAMEHNQHDGEVLPSKSNTARWAEEPKGS